MPIKPYEQDYIELLEKTMGDSPTIIKQMRIGTSKADLVAIWSNYSAIAFEIKTERDNLRRLQTQLSDYQTLFTEVVILTYEKQALKLAEELPSHIGLMYVDADNRLCYAREPKRYTYSLSRVAIFDALSTKLALEVLKTFKIQIPELPNTQIRTALLGIFQSLDVIKLQKVAMDVLYRHHTTKTGKGQVV